MQRGLPSAFAVALSLVETVRADPAVQRCKTRAHRCTSQALAASWTGRSGLVARRLPARVPFALVLRTVPEEAMTTHTMPHDSMRQHRTTAELGRYLVPLGRVLMSLIFVQTLMFHFSPSAVAYAREQGVPLPNILVPLSGIMAIAGGLSIAFGYHARLGAGLLIAFLIPVTLLMHQFWNVADPMMANMQRVMFMKNVSILGGLMLLVYFGAGPTSVDARHDDSESTRQPSSAAE
jgi:putative oxidoreductase